MKRYHEIMERLKVTEDMRGRVLENIKKADSAAKNTSGTLRFPRCLSAAACLAVLLAGALVLPGRLHMGAQSPPDTLAPGSSIVEVDSIRELSDAVGFEVCGLDGLPFPVEEQTYTVYWQKLAEILYSSGTQSAVFRKSAGTADNSGDYRVFEDTDTLALDEAAVTLKGNGGGYTIPWPAGPTARFPIRCRLQRDFPGRSCRRCLRKTAGPERTAAAPLSRRPPGPSDGRIWREISAGGAQKK